ncbi:MAG: hypothetical protein MSS69_00645 [Spirochaetales bacterium]|nr:hypothetical protein [Spirochaetales bacterium]
MKKRVLIILISILLLLPLSAKNDYFDLAFMIGQGNYTWPVEGIGVSYGVDIGITDKIELGFWGISELIPNPFESTLLGAEVSFALMGQRNTGSKVSGVNINMLLSLGGFWKTNDNGMGVMIGVTPLAVGSPALTRRERCLRTNVGWDFVNKKVIVAFSPMDVDIYVKGTYRDWI